MRVLIVYAVWFGLVLLIVNTIEWIVTGGAS